MKNLLSQHFFLPYETLKNEEKSSLCLKIEANVKNLIDIGK